MKPTRTFPPVDVAGMFLSCASACLRRPVLISCNRRAEVTLATGVLKMAGEKPIQVAIIGLGFGAEFIPIYQKYPGAEIYAICRRDRKGLDECGDRYKIAKRYTDYREMLKDPDLDAVHINSPIPDH